MTCTDLVRILLLSATLFSIQAWSAPLEITLPPENAQLKPSSYPGRVVAMQKCAICHSVDYVNMQPPHMTLTQWTAEVTKMQHAYGAPLSDEDITQISDYLTSSYGDAKPAMLATPASTQTQPGKAKPAATTTAGSIPAAATVDAKSLLNANACLGCHSIDNKVVGPAYKDVAAHYRGVANALTKVQGSIRNGGAGKWGAVPMPGYPGLSQNDLRVLAEFILKQ